MFYVLNVNLFAWIRFVLKTRCHYPFKPLPANYPVDQKKIWHKEMFIFMRKTFQEHAGDNTSYMRIHISGF